MYKVHTICIGRGITNPHYTHYNRMECEIIAPLQLRTGGWRLMNGCKVMLPPLMLYRVRWSDMSITYAEHHNLRPKFLPPDAGTGLTFILNLFKEPA